MQSHLGEEEARFWTEAEEGGKDGWFNGAPFPEEEADVRFAVPHSTVELY